MITTDIHTGQATSTFTVRVELEDRSIATVKVVADFRAPIVDVDDAAWDALFVAGKVAIATLSINEAS